MNSATTFLKLFVCDLKVSDVMDRLEQTLKAKNVMVFARINHSKAAHDVFMELADEEVLIFGNPKAGTPLMQAFPVFGIELPLKILAFRQNEKTWVGYQNLHRLAELLNVPTDNPTLQMLENFLAQLLQTVLEKNCEVK